MNNTDNALCADAVARFLSQHPDFFTQHADVFADLRVPHPYASRAISLGERQVMTLRAKIKELEGQLHGLAHTAHGNENISHTLTQWCVQMLAETDAAQLPRHITQSLATLFELSAVALRLWDLPRLPEGNDSADVSVDIRDFAARLTEPVCARACDQAVLAWLPETTASIAIIPLKDRSDANADEPASPACFGLLVLASADAERFTPEMGTEFLRMLGELAQAAVSRLR